ncbi:uncharacterized protein J3R85_019902 [Psidium guajava]|nr:uncharacterized protein J3R85_019902 [Psidium guajava]
MSLCLLSSRSLHPIASHHLSPAASAPRFPPPVAPASLRLSPASTLAPSPTCALQCPHFQSDARRLFSLVLLLSLQMSQLASFRRVRVNKSVCSGCTHELNLSRPSVVEGAVNFFKSLGVSDFTFACCKLFRLITRRVWCGGGGESFWGVCGTLIIKKSWREAYYGFVDRMTNNLVALIASRRGPTPNLTGSPERLPDQEVGRRYSSSPFYPLRPKSHAAKLRCARPAPRMSLCLLSSRSLHPIASRHLSPAASAPPFPPPPVAPASLRLRPASTLAPSPTCALQCPHFQSCSGCTHELNLDRPSVVDDAVNFFKSLGVSDFTFDGCKLWGWRCRAKLAVRGSSADPLIGLYEEGTHNVVDIPNCKAHHPNINAAMELLKQGIRELGIEPHNEDQGTGDLRYVQMAVTTYNTSIPASERYQHGRVQVALVWNSRNENSPSSDKLNALARFLWRNSGSKRKVPLIHSVWANFQTSTSNVIFGNRWRHLLGDRDFWEHLGGIDVSLAPSSFGQANTRVGHVSHPGKPY